MAHHAWDEDACFFVVQHEQRTGGLRRLERAVDDVAEHFVDRLRAHQRPADIGEHLQQPRGVNHHGAGRGFGAVRADRPLDHASHQRRVVVGEDDVAGRLNAELQLDLAEHEAIAVV
jgi:hypothetical protein